MLGEFVKKGEQVFYRVVRKERTPSNPQMMIYDAFDYEHHLGRHASFFWASDLIERGPDYLEYALGPKLLGFRTAKQPVRITYVSSRHIEADVLEGPAKRLHTTIQAAPDPDGSAGELIWTWSLEVPAFLERSLIGRAVSPVLAAVLHTVGKRVSAQLAAVDFEAWRSALDALGQDEYLTNGILIRGPAGAGASRRERLALETMVRGCADCGRHELGFLYGGEVRCAPCDYRAIHSGPGHNAALTGSRLSCAPCMTGPI